MSVIERVSGLLTDVAEIARTTEAPDDLVEAAQLLAAVHDVDKALDRLHETAGCVAPLDRHNRCTACGRQVGLQGGQPHRRRGCVTVIPFIHANLIFSIPVLGKALWLLCRSRATALSPAGGRVGASLLPPSAAAAAGGSGRTIHEEQR